MVRVKKAPIDYVTQPIQVIIKNESVIGILLFLSAAMAMILANSSWGAEWYHHIWENKIVLSYGGKSLELNLHHFINDGLMAIFFFLVGLEIKREFLAGELSGWRKAALPVGAAIGGMIFPALIYLTFTFGTDAAHGWGIPMATDIAFTLGLIHLLNKRISPSVVVFVTSLAVVDDIGAVFVIAFFYTSQLHVDQLIIAGSAWIVLMAANKLGVRNVFFYMFIGISVIWISFFYSGMHPTVAGILLALTIPVNSRITKSEYTKALKKLFRKYIRLGKTGTINTHKEDRLLHKIRAVSDEARTPLQKIEGSLHTLVYFVIMPLFAFANAGVKIEANFLDMLFGSIGMGVILGLIFGKIIGISLVSRLLVALKIGQLPKGSNWRQIYTVSVFAGIGFTMSLFIAELAFTNPDIVDAAKAAILVASALAAVIGLIGGRMLNKKIIKNEIKDDKVSEVIFKANR